MTDGKHLADILAVDGDPLKDISVLRDSSNIKMVFKGGQRKVFGSE